MHKDVFLRGIHKWHEVSRKKNRCGSSGEVGGIGWGDGGSAIVVVMIPWVVCSVVTGLSLPGRLMEEGKVQRPPRRAEVHVLGAIFGTAMNYGSIESLYSTGSTTEEHCGGDVMVERDTAVLMS